MFENRDLKFDRTIYILNVGTILTWYLDGGTYFPLILQDVNEKKLQ